MPFAISIVKPTTTKKSPRASPSGNSIMSGTNVYENFNLVAAAVYSII